MKFQGGELKQHDRHAPGSENTSGEVVMMVEAHYDSTSRLRIPALGVSSGRAE
ncbi:MAG TPA: hypothetical protein PKK74_04745 [Candidatus Methanoculleus thermohydrogenotrophicum]|nr:hypothetical protein [Candidatus Methanoculleus thermohydrogenotrophicum]NLM82240.1 hypothetical protein [Candidatus Methanoculleus thermohydrogenotrophicum]HOB17985.1 hypothetical protein [Candidatus Methanoculleus thermohydrogenotrophicum]HPZ38215.1 hypothetical protein [Candidatus Methanoculleus thermohydrogenotrophicum]HQC91342.1 hypothetical protein [Candidatus Methanoculleus thermohydrogenotrophicum]